MFYRPLSDYFLTEFCGESEKSMYDDLNLLNCKVRHKTLGTGNVVWQNDTYIGVKFVDSEIKFQYPKAFESFLQCEDEGMQNQLLSFLTEKQALEAREQEERKKLLEKETKERAVTMAKKPVPTRKTIGKKENIAFKCNYCNGGQNQNSIGYQCACTDTLIDYNIEIAKHNWCCSMESPCRQYHDGIIDRHELDHWAEDGGFVCYESQMLRNWTAFAGFVLTGDNKQKPMKLSKVQVNSLAVLTTREPYEPETKRFIFGVFLVDEAYEGDNRDEGYVTTSSKYKIGLSKEEAKSIKFWNYYRNENAPERIAWGKGLHRYITDIQAASILNDIADLKIGTEDEELAQEFLTYFCRINSIDTAALPMREGALVKK